MTEIDDRIEMTVSIGDTVVTRPGFGVVGILHKHGQSALDRVETYLSRTAGLAVFPLYTPVGQMINRLFSQENVPESVKVIYQGDAESAGDALDAALLVDPDFYFVLSPTRDKTIQTAIAAWALAEKRLHVFSSQEAEAITSADTDIFSVIQALSNDRSIGYFSKKAGTEFDITAITVSGTSAVVATTTPPEEGDTVGIWGSVVAALNGVYTVESVVADTSFTITVASGTSSDVAASEGWSNMNLLEAAIVGKMAPYDAGSRSWDLQTLAAVTADKLSGTEQTHLGNKNVNWFTTLAGLNVTSGPKSGGGGKTLHGRYADIRRGTDWLTTNLQLDNLELMIASGGDLGFDADGFQKVQTKNEIRMADGINKKFLTTIVSGPYAGQDYNVEMPSLSSIPSSEKLSRLLDGIKIDGAIRGKIHNVGITLTLAP